MSDLGNLDDWIKKAQSTNFSKSMHMQDEITLHSLRERIVELEKIRDAIVYELNKLRSFTGSD